MVIVGGGESIKGFDLSKLKDVIAVNWSYKYTSYKYCCFLDRNFWDKAAPDPGRCVTADHISFRDVDITKANINANNSGVFAIKYAISLGYEKIYLLGFDCKGGHYYDTKPCLVDYSETIRHIEAIKWDLTTVGETVLNLKNITYEEFEIRRSKESSPGDSRQG